MDSHEKRRTFAPLASGSIKSPNERAKAFQGSYTSLFAYATPAPRFEIDHLRAHGQLTSNYPPVDDLTDKVLARVYRDLHTLKEPADVQRKLFRIVIEVAKEDAAESQPAS